MVETGEDGRLEDAVILGDPDGDFFIKLEAGTKVTGTGGIPLSRLELEIVEKYIALPDDTVALSPVYRLTGYAADGRETGVLFDPAAVLTLKYNAGDIPENSYLPFLIRYSDQDGITYLTIPYGAVIEPGEAQAFIDSDGYFLVVTEVAPPPPPLPASFVASDLLISPSEVLEGNPVRISVTITNEGALSGSHELYLVIDGIVRATQEVTLGSKSSETLTFELSNLGAGSHQVKIAGLTGTIRVTLPPTEPLTAGVNWLALDLGVGAAVIAGLIAWFFFMRRTRRRAVLK